MPVIGVEKLKGELERAKREIRQLKFSNSCLTEWLGRLEATGEFQEKVELSLDLGQLAEILIDEAAQLIKTEVAALFLVEPHSRTFKLKASRPSDLASLCAREVEEQIKSGVFSWVLNQRRLAIIPSLGLGEGRGELIMIPLITAKRTIGIFLLLPGIPVDLIPQELLKLLSVMVKQASFAIENCELYQGLREYSLNLKKIVEERTQKLKETQSQLLHSTKLAAVGQLAAGVAHELNNPLGGILGYTQWLLERVEGMVDQRKDVDQVKRWLEFIEEETQRCKRIVGGLLEFSRQEEMDFAPLDVNQILQESLLLSAHSLKLKQIRLIKRLDPSLPQIQGNASQLQQVFTNLILNAQQAMPRGGVLRVRSSFSSQSREVKVEFQDSGSGIPSAHLNRIFEPFFTTKKRGEGTGLGLSISYGIVKSHRGHIEVESEEDKGATFTVCLPEGREVVHR